MKLTILLVLLLCLVPLAAGDVKEELTRTFLQAVSTLQSENSACDRCEAFLGDVKDKLDSDTFQELMVAYVYSLICLEFPSVSHKVCHQLVQNTVPPLLTSYAALVVPNEFCTKNMFCSSTFEEDFKELKDDVLKFIERVLVYDYRNLDRKSRKEKGIWTENLEKRKMKISHMDTQMLGMDTNPRAYLMEEDFFGGARI